MNGSADSDSVRKSVEKHVSLASIANGTMLGVPDERRKRSRGKNIFIKIYDESKWKNMVIMFIKNSRL